MSLNARSARPVALFFLITVCLAIGGSALGNVCEGLNGSPGDVDGDGFSPPADCAVTDPSIWSLPLSVQNLEIEQNFDGAKIVVWDGVEQARSYNLYRSTSPTLAPSDCHAPNLPVPGFEDPDDPQSGQVFYYLAQAENDCGVADVGTDSSGTPRPALNCDCATLCDDGNACTRSVCDNGQCTNVDIEPVILRSPTDATACVGLDADLYVQATGTGNLSYQWLIDGVPAGTNNPTLILPNLALALDGARITVEVTDGCATALAGPATLSVFASTSSCTGGLSGFEPPNGSGASTAGLNPLYVNRKFDQGSVELHSGENVVGNCDLHADARGLHFDWCRTYRSREPNESAQGRNWVHSYARRIEWLANPGGPLLLHDGSQARIDVYEPDPQLPGCWTSPGFFRTLCVQPDQRFVLTFADRHEWIFRALDVPPFDGQIEAEVDRNGNAALFQYDPGGRLEQIVDTLGRPYQITYNADNFIETVADFTGRAVTYDYYEDGDAGGGTGDLKSVTTPAVVATPTGNDFPDGKTTTYTYTTGFADDRLNHNLLTITDPREQIRVDFAYMATTLPVDARFDRLDHVTLPNGKMSFVYDHPPFDPQFPDVVSKTIVNDRAGNVAEYFFDSGNRLIRRLDFTGRADASLPTDGTTNRPGPPLRPADPPFYESVAQYNSDSLPLFVQNPNGNQVQLQYDSPNPDPRFRANLLQRTWLPGPLGGDQGQITESWTYTTNFGSARRVALRPQPERADYTFSFLGPYYGGQNYDAEFLGAGLHHEGIVHRDIAARNSLATEDGGYVETAGSNWDKRGNNPRRAASGCTEDRWPCEGDLDFNDVFLRSRGLGGGTGSGMGTLAGTGTGDRLRVEVIDGQVRYPRAASFPSTYTDPRGLQYGYTYDPNGNLRTVTTPQVTTGVLGGGVQSIVHDFQYNAFGQLRLYTNPASRVDRFTYFTNGPQTGYLQDAIVDDGGFALTTTYEYDLLGRVTRVTDPRGNDTQILLNELDQVVRSTSTAPFSYEVDTYYDANDNVVRVDRQNVDENGALDANSHLSRTWDYDILDRVIRDQTETDDGGECYVGELEYDANDNQTLRRKGEATNGNDPDNTVRTLYDERDLLFEAIRAEGGADQSTTRYEYDGNGNTTGVREGTEAGPGANDTTHTYDGYDRLTNTTDASGNVETRNYDANDNVVRVQTDGEELQGSGLPPIRLFERDLVYDEIDRLVTSETEHFDTALPQNQIGDGISTHEWFHDPDSRLIRAEDDNGHPSTHLYDSARRLSEIVDAKGNSRLYTYDANSNVTDVTDTEQSDLAPAPEIFTTSFTYDELDRVTRTTDNDGNEWDYDYDSRHNLRIGIDALDNVVRLEYDGADRVVRTQRELTTTGTGVGAPAGEIETLYCWDDSSRQTCRIDDSGNITIYVYDSLDRLTRTDFADGTHESILYDVKDDPVERTDPNGTQVTSTYDGLHRLVGNDVVPAAGVSGPVTETFDYDGLSRIVRAENDDTVTTWTYDSMSNLTEETLQIGAGPVRTSSMTYDGVGNCTSTTYPSSFQVQTTYDELDRALQILSNAAPAATYSYFGPGRVERVDRPGGYRTDYEYDSLRRTTRVHSHDTVTTVADHTYLYDAMDNTTSRIDQVQGGPARTFEYDSAYRLVGTTNSTAPSVDYTLDGPGNRTQVTGGPDAGSYTLSPGGDFEMNQYTATPNGARSYDNNGNLTLSTDPGGVTQYAFDYRDLMTQATVPGPITHTYTYDALGRRVERADTSSGETTRYYYDGLHVVEEQDQNDAERATYVYGRGLDRPLERRVVISPVVSFDNLLYMDTLHVVAAQDATSTTIQERYRYGDYGEPQVVDSMGAPLPASGIGNPYLFRAGRYDPETRYYYDGSYLDTHAGRSTTRSTSMGGSPWSNPGVRGNGDLGEIKVIVKGKKIAGPGDNGGNGEIKVIINTKKIAGPSVDDGVIRDFNWTQLDGPDGTKAGIGGAGMGVGKAVIKCVPRTPKARCKTNLGSSGYD